MVGKGDTRYHRTCWHVSFLKSGTVDDRELIFSIDGLVGFDYRFDSLTRGEENEVVRAFMDMFAPQQRPAIVAILGSYFPLLSILVCCPILPNGFTQLIPTTAQPTKRGKAVNASRAILNRVGKQLVEEKRAAVPAASDDGSSVEKKTVASRDLLTVLSEHTLLVVYLLLMAMLRCFALQLRPISPET